MSIIFISINFDKITQIALYRLYLSRYIQAVLKQIYIQAVLKQIYIQAVLKHIYIQAVLKQAVLKQIYIGCT